MDFNIDEYKINKCNFFIKGWAHFDAYKIILVSKSEEIEIKNYQSRYDICMSFHENIDDNKYGFNEEITFSEPIKKLNVYLEVNKEKTLIATIDNRKGIIFLKKIKKKLGKIKRGTKFLWREYHFIVPPTMLKKYILMVLKKAPEEKLYNPEILSEYNEWLLLQNYKKDSTNIDKDITILGKDITIDKKELETVNDINKIKTKYTLLCNSKIDLPSYFYSELDNDIDKYDITYFDNDFVEDNKYKDPSFKPNWSRDTILGVNYIGHCILVKTSILKKYKTTNIYELLLNYIDEKDKIKHIHKIMYHDYKKIENNYEITKKYLNSKKINYELIKNPDKVSNTLIYKTKTNPLISIIIPTKDHADILERCLESIYEKTTYKNYEIIVIDNNSEEEETFKLLKKYEKKHNNFRSKRIECEFNYSYLNNEAVKISKGEYVVLLNNDTEIITGQWLSIMLGYAMQEHIGVVGVKLLFPDDTIQHVGIVMGKGGLAGHPHYGDNKDLITNGYELKIPYDVSACTAACIMISKEKYNLVKGLEEQLKVAFNDVDFNLKLLDKEYNNILLPNVMLYHYESKSRGLDTSSEKQKRFVQEWAFVQNRWQKYIDHDPYYNDNYNKNNDYML